MLKKNALFGSGGYLDWPYNEDYFLWARMFLSNRCFANTGTVLVNVRTGKDQFSRRGGKVYFKSEVLLQKYMLKNRVIGILTFLINCFKRFIVQILTPNSLRQKIYIKIARSRK